MDQQRLILPIGNTSGLVFRTRIVLYNLLSSQLTFSNNMKPWLLNILACPIDKHHPLQAYFFTWETSPLEIEKIKRDSGKPNKYFTERYRHLTKQVSDGTISPASIRVIIDHTGVKETVELLNETTRVVSDFELLDKKEAKELFNNHREDLDTLYRYLNLLEVQEGLLVCPRCNRWYPIGNAVEGIPEMMPDELREKGKDLYWLKKWSKLIPESILNDGKPFNFRENLVGN